MELSKQDVSERINLSLKDKIDLSICRIEQWHNKWSGKVYVSFSGGKDSTVLLHLVRSIFPKTDAVFLQTGLEYPEINSFVNETKNVTCLKPKKSFLQVIREYGYPVINKENAQKIHEIRTTKSEKLRNKRLYGDKNGHGKLPQKWHKFLDAPFLISHQCCNQLKKNPVKQYERKTGNKPMLGTMISESVLRWTTYRKYGCNMYNSKRPISHPIAFWKENDIWEYIHLNNVAYSKIYDMGYERTGCMFCAFGVHKEKYPNKFQRMEKTHPQLYKYCIEKLELGSVLNYMNIPYQCTQTHQLQLFKED